MNPAMVSAVKRFVMKRSLRVRRIRANSHFPTFPMSRPLDDWIHLKIRSGSG